MGEILRMITSMRPPLRSVTIEKKPDQQCGFHLSRSQWDPYPWISQVDENTPAHDAGLTVGDFIIEVNSEDVLGLRIEEIAHKVKLKGDTVRLVVWKAAASETEIYSKHPAVFYYKQFSDFLQSALQLTECPVCLESASSPTFQCVNGHILCVKCIVKTCKCPICRVALSGKGRCLVVDKLRNLIFKTLAAVSETPALGINTDNPKSIILPPELNWKDHQLRSREGTHITPIT